MSIPQIERRAGMSAVNIPRSCGSWARHQQGKSWELRTATSYARLMRNQGCMRGAYDLLASIYGWFIEAFGRKDLKEAKALPRELRELAPQAAAEVTAVSDSASPG